MLPGEYREQMAYDVQHGCLIASATYWPAPGRLCPAYQAHEVLADWQADDPAYWAQALARCRAALWETVATQALRN
jgi:hypothetical protein